MVVFSNVQRNHVRRALAASPEWKAKRAALGLDTSMLSSTVKLIDACERVGFDWRAALATLDEINDAFGAAPTIKKRETSPEPDGCDDMPQPDPHKVVPEPTVMPREAIDARLIELGLLKDDNGAAPLSLPKVRHKLFGKLLDAAQAARGNGLNIYLAGPASSGKTHAAKLVAASMGLPFYVQGKSLDAIELTGYCDAGGTYRSVPFVDAYRHGGVILLDEIDGYATEAALAINVPLSGDIMFLPNGERVERHADFVCLAAGNTLGTGATHAFTARNRLDESTLSRFPVVLDWQYDEAMELALMGDDKIARSWCREIQTIRAYMTEQGFTARVPDLRTMQAGASLLATGAFTKADVRNMTYLAGLDADAKGLLVSFIEAKIAERKSR